MLTFSDGVHEGISDQDYHHGIKNVYSSSQLKDIYKYGVEYFANKYVYKTLDNDNDTEMRIGSYVHSAFLEPEKLDEQVVIYDKVRRGKAWEEFAFSNQDKVILNKAEAEKAGKYLKAIKPYNFINYFNDCSKKEVAAISTFTVSKGNVFDRRGMMLTENGWQKTNLSSEGGQKIRVKAKADQLITDDFEFGNVIGDLKTTRSNIGNDKELQRTIVGLGYDFSAAMYWAIFETELCPIDGFYWTFVGKSSLTCKLKKADLDYIKIGRKKLIKALIEMSNYLELGIEHFRKESEKVSIISPAKWDYI